jgi:hypothetical protein
MLMMMRKTGPRKSEAIFCSLLLCVCAAVAGTDPVDSSAPRDTLLFNNGDRLYGTLDSIDTQNGIRWRHSDVAEPIEFKPDNIAEIEFSRKASAGRSAGDTTRIKMRDDDELEGRIALFDDDKIILETSYAGPVTIPRDWVKLIVPVPAEGATIFTGPDGLDGWTMGKSVSALGDAGQWHYRKGAFYATNSASIARRIDLPDSATFEFDLAWQGLFQLAIALYTDHMQPINLVNKESEPDFGGFYSLQLNSFSANLLVVKKNEPLRYLGQVTIAGFHQKSSAQIQIRACKARRSVSMLVDGKLVKHWIDPEGFAGEGDGIRLVHQGQGKLKLSNLLVAEWDGQFEETPPPQTNHPQDLSRLRNGDQVSGGVQTIRDGKLVVAVDRGNREAQVQSTIAGYRHAPLEIPMNRVKQIEMAGRAIDAQELPKGNTMRVYFRRGGTITFQLDHWNQEKVYGVHPKLGRIELDPTALARAELMLKSPLQQPSASN